LSTENPPHNNCTIEFPIPGIAEKRLVITVAPQKLICPQGSTYPLNPVAILRKKISLPEYHRLARG
jgi:hypothetical protein